MPKKDQMFDPKTNFDLVVNLEKFLEELNSYVATISYMVDTAEYSTKFAENDPDSNIWLVFGDFKDDVSTKVVIPEIRRLIDNNQLNNVLVTEQKDADKVQLTFSLKMVDQFAMGVFMPMDPGRTYPFTHMVHELRRFKEYLATAEA